jgi:hypothetical protein
MASAQSDPETYLTPAKIALLLDCHPSAPVRWIQKGCLLSTGERMKLAAVSTPGGWRVRPKDLNSFLEALTADRRRPAPAPAPIVPTPSRASRLKGELAAAGF